MDSSIVPEIYHPEELDGVLPVSTEEAWDICERLSTDEGILVGHSSGAAVAGAVRLARRAVGRRQAGRDRHGLPRSRRPLLRGSPPDPDHPLQGEAVSTQGPHPRLSPAALDEIYAHAAPRLPQRVLRHRVRPQGAAAGRSGQGLPQHPGPAARRGSRRCTRAPPATPTTWSRRRSSPWRRACAATRPAKIVYHSHIDVGAYFSDDRPGGGPLRRRAGLRGGVRGGRRQERRHPRRAPVRLGRRAPASTSRSTSTRAA